MTMNAILDPKVQMLVALGAATAAKCQKCFAKLYGAAADLEVSDAELRAVVGIAQQVVDKSHGFMAEFVCETTNGAVRIGDGAPARCGC